MASVIRHNVQSLPIVTVMASYEIPDGGGYIAPLEIAAAAQLLGDVGRDILRPALDGIECEDADRIFILPFQ